MENYNIRTESPIPDFENKIEEVLEKFEEGGICVIPHDFGMMHCIDHHCNPRMGEDNVSSSCMTITMWRGDADSMHYVTEKITIVMVTPFDDRKIGSSFNDAVHVVVLKGWPYPIPVFQKTSAQYNDVFVKYHLPKVLHHQLKSLNKDMIELENSTCNVII